MANTQTFESVAQVQERARKRLPRSVYTAVLAGTESGVTADDNVQAFREVGFWPRIGAELPAARDLTRTVLGERLSMPVLISPTGAQAVHPQGELPLARAAAGSGTAAGLSSFATRPMEEIVAANPRTFFQLYWIGSRDLVSGVLARAQAAGVKGIILTLDWSFANRSDWGSPGIPDRLDLRSMLRFAPEVVVRPQWLLGFARTGGPPDLVAPNMGVAGEPPPAAASVYRDWKATPAPSWDDVAWLRAQWPAQLVIKGVTHPDDARRAADLGADAISVSNHGGNNLDGTPGTLRALPGIVDAVGNQLDVLFDGGIRRGSDVVKALAFGARAVMVGRAPLWGLAANGEAGVRNVLDILRAGIDETLIGLGHASIEDISLDDLIVPSSFARRSADSRSRP